MKTEMLQQLRNRLLSGSLHLYVLALLMNVSSLRSAGNSGQSLPATQTIVYASEHATEVFLVWGVNGWNLPSHYPEGSFVKDNLVYTPMLSEKGKHVAKIDLPQHTIIDYVFWITKGPRGTGADIWDKNKKDADYHSYLLNSSTTLIEPAVEIKPAQPLTIMDFAGSLTVISVLVTLLIFLLVKFRYLGIQKQPTILVTMSAAAFSLMCWLMLIRPSAAGVSWDIYFNPAHALPLILKTGYYDFLFVLVFSGMFLSAAWALKNRKKWQLFVAVTYLTLCVVALLASLLNIRIIEMLGKPFNYQWLYYSDFLNSPDSKAAVAANVNKEYVLNIVLTVLCAGLSVYIFSWAFMQIVMRKWPVRIFSTASLLFISLYFFYGLKIKSSPSDYDKLANPVTAFLQSVNPFAGNPSLFTAQVPDSLVYKKPEAQELKTFVNPDIRNVLVFVMESTPAEYVDVYGGKYNVTPNLTKYSENAIVFKNMYAHAPATNLSMVSLLGSVYPWLSYNSLTEEHPDMNIPTLVSELKRKGYSAGFFNSADNRYQRAGEFLNYRGFDCITDCESGSCSEEMFTVESDWEYMNGKSDACTADELTNWIRQKKDKPFFGMMWTYQTHYPYFIQGQEKDYKTGDPSLNKYLNALHNSDAVFGKLMSDLKKQDLLKSTLVLVVGDHGEAFGRHGQISHGRMIYEENLHVPCMLINPSFKKNTVEQVGGLVDIAPTITALLGIKQPKEWLGENMLISNPDKRTYFFAPWSDYLFGYREGNHKIIYNATRNTTEVYDLSTDPFEEENLAAKLPDEVEVGHLRLAAWTQFVNRYMLTTLTEKPRLKLAVVGRR